MFARLVTSLKNSKTIHIIFIAICPSGIAWTDKAYDENSAHQSAECSNRGLCDRKTVLENAICMLLPYCRAAVNALLDLKGKLAKEVSGFEFLVHVFQFRVIHAAVVMEDA